METIVFFEYSAYAETGDRLKIPITNFKEIFKLLTIEYSWRERIYVARNVWMEDRNRDRGGCCDKEAASSSSNLIGIVGRL